MPQKGGASKGAGLTEAELLERAGSGLGAQFFNAWQLPLASARKGHFWEFGRKSGERKT